MTDPLLPSLFLAVALLGIIPQGEEDFTPGWPRYPPSLIFQQLSFAMELSTSISSFLTPLRSCSIISQVFSTSAFRLIVIVLFIFCTIFPYYVTASASTLPAVENFGLSLTALVSFVFLFLSIWGAISSTPRASSQSRTF
jgi:hypothetical protein